MTRRSLLASAAALCGLPAAAAEAPKVAILPRIGPAKLFYRIVVRGPSHHCCMTGPWDSSNGFGRAMESASVIAEPHDEIEMSMGKTQSWRDEAWTPIFRCLASNPFDGRDAGWLAACFEHALHA